MNSYKEAYRDLCNQVVVERKYNGKIPSLCDDYCVWGEK